MTGDNAEKYLRRQAFSQDLVTTSTFAGALYLLRYKEVDAMVMLELVTERLMDELGYRKDAGQLYRLELSTYELVEFPYNWCTDHVQGMDWAFASHCKYKSNLIEQILEQRA